MTNFKILLITISGLIIFYLFFATFLVSEKDVKKYAKKENWQNYTVDGYCYFGCAEGDWFQTKFIATDKEGQEFTGCICSSFFKGATLRLN